MKQQPHETNNSTELTSINTKPLTIPSLDHSPMERRFDANQGTNDFVTRLSLLIEKFTPTLRPTAEGDKAIETFILFWKKLFPINKIMRDFHETHLNKIQILEARLTYFKQLQYASRGLEPKLFEWFNRAATAVMPIPSQAAYNTGYCELIDQINAHQIDVDNYERSTLAIKTYQLELLLPPQNTVNAGYLYVCADEQQVALHYKVIGPQGETQEGSIPIAQMPPDLKAAFTTFCQTNDVKLLSPVLPQLIQITAEAGHTLFLGCIWNSKDYLFLLASLTQGSIVRCNRPEAVKFLQNIAYSVLQKLDPTSKGTLNMGNGLNHLLCSIVKIHSQYSPTERHRIFYLTIERGLIALGANLRNWIDANWKNNFEGIPTATLCVAAEQAVMLLSHLTDKAGYLPDVATHVRLAVNQVVHNAKVFAEKLLGIVVMDDASWFPTLIKTITPTGALREQAILYLAVVNWVDSLLNTAKLTSDEKGKLHDHEDGQNPFLTHAIQAYKSATDHWYHFLFRNGSTYWLGLEKSIKVLAAEVHLSDLPKQRNHHCVALKKLRDDMDIMHQSMIVKLDEVSEGITLDVLLIKLERLIYLKLPHGTVLENSPEAHRLAKLIGLLYTSQREFTPFMKRTDISSWPLLQAPTQPQPSQSTAPHIHPGIAGRGSPAQAQVDQDNLSSRYHPL